MSRHMGQFFVASSMPVFILTQYMNSNATEFASIGPCALGVAVLVLCLVVMLVPSFSHLSLQFHLWLHPHLWMTNMAAVASVPHPLLMASHGILVLPRFLGAYYIVLLFFFILLPCSLVCPSKMYCNEGNTHAWKFLISVSWLCLDTQSGRIVVARLVQQTCGVLMDI